MLSIKGLEKTFVEKNSSFKLQINELNLNSKGMVFVLGKSGSGKSTFLNLIGLIDNPDKGEIRLDNKNILNLSNFEKSKLIANQIGFIFQNFNLIEDLTVIENIQITCDGEANNNINKTLINVGLDKFKNKKIKNLSGGQKQRVAIARAIIKKPKLLLCDEPTGSLDNKNAHRIMSLLKEQSKESLVIVVSHNKELSDIYADEVLEMSNGQIISCKTQNNFVENEKPNTFSNEHNFAKLTKKNLIKLSLRLFKKRICSFILAGIISTFSLSCLLINGSLKNVDYLTTEAKAIQSTLDNSLSFKQSSSYVVLNDNRNGEDSTFNQFTDNDIALIKENLNVSRVDVLKTSQVAINSNFAKPLSFNNKKHNPMFYKRISGFIECDQQLIEDYGFSILSGTMPIYDNQIMITKYRFKSFENFGYKNGNDVIENVTKDNLIGKSIVLTGEIDREYIISGIIDTGNYFDDYLNESYVDYSVTVDKDIQSELLCSIHNAVFCKDLNSINLTQSENNVACIPLKDDLFDIKKTICAIEEYTHVVTINESGEEIRLTKTIKLIQNQYLKCKNAETNFTSISSLLDFTQYIIILISGLFVFLYYFTLTSNQRKDFGILKCLGIENKDVYKIMFIHGCESSLIIICLSLLFHFINICISNAFIKKEIGIFTNLLNINWVFVLISILVLFVVTAFSILIPMLKFEKKTAAKLIKG